MVSKSLCQPFARFYDAFNEPQVVDGAGRQGDRVTVADAWRGRIGERAADGRVSLRSSLAGSLRLPNAVPVSPVSGESDMQLCNFRVVEA